MPAIGAADDVHQRALPGAIGLGEHGRANLLQQGVGRSCPQEQRSIAARGFGLVTRSQRKAEHRLLRHRFAPSALGGDLDRQSGLLGHPGLGLGEGEQCQVLGGNRTPPHQPSGLFQRGRTIRALGRRQCDRGLGIAAHRRRHERGERGRGVGLPVKLEHGGHHREREQQPDPEHPADHACALRWSAAIRASITSAKPAKARMV